MRANIKLIFVASLLAVAGDVRGMLGSIFKHSEVQVNFNRTLAVRMMKYSSIAYANSTALRTLSCPLCKELKSSFAPRAVLSNARLRLRAFLGFDKRLDATVVVFRGTANPDNWCGNFMVAQVKPRELGNFPGRVHGGFYAMYLGLRKHLLDELTALLASEGRGKDVFVTGHSLGGALATIAAVDLTRKYPKNAVTMYNFGSPRVGDASFVKYYAATVLRSFRVVNAADPVTEVPLPIMLYKHVPKRVEVSTSEEHSEYLGVRTTDSGEKEEEKAPMERPACLDLLQPWRSTEKEFFSELHNIL